MAIGDDNPHPICPYVCEFETVAQLREDVMSVDVIDENKVCREISARDGHSRSFVKAVSWRITGTLDTFVISLFVTGKATIAGSIAATELLTKIALYYGHERAWTAIRWGRH